MVRFRRRLNEIIMIDLGEEGVETVDFLAFFNKGIILGYTEQGEFLHEVDLMRLSHMFLLLEGQRINR